MGTRSLTIIREDGRELLTLYRQMDGYPTGHGAALADFMAGRVIVNGIPCGSDAPARMSNGAGCFAAGLTAALKRDQVGSVYVYPTGSRDVGEEYTYNVGFLSPSGGAPGFAAVVVERSGWGDFGASGDPDKGRASEAIFKGDAAEYVAWIRKAQRRENARDRARRKREGWAPRVPAYSATDALADLADVVGRMHRGEATTADATAVLRRFGAADDAGNVSRATVRAIRAGAEDSYALGVAVRFALDSAKLRRKRGKLARI